MLTSEEVSLQKQEQKLRVTLFGTQDTMFTQPISSEWRTVLFFILLEAKSRRKTKCP
jgi:hypothetical protein